NVGGAGTLDAGGVTAATFTYPNDTWIFVQVIVDLDIDQAQFWMDGTMIYQWQWTLGALGGGGSLQLNANDFFGAVATDETYYDDYQVLDLIIPVELTSFTASVNEGNVVLNWSTATETNNHLFEIERKAETSEYITIGYVEGAGTTTEPQNYSYTDNEVETGTYTYRLKQVDFDGTFTYSNEVEVDVTAPLSFNLDQNYPNPFNPTTNINYSIQEAGNIILAVYNTVGEKVAVLVNGYSEAGHFEVSFDASNLPSGVYLYKLQSANSVQTKKMMLLK
ncbi:MAG: T9SS type A sorting domain-containing protein, partial [Ignavibacteriaceae bacterium]|nr:T9SS type A sorting domain-containing protein [Ignavibacteriaceae bacterium]